MGSHFVLCRSVPFRSVLLHQTGIFSDMFFFRISFIFCATNKFTIAYLKMEWRDTLMLMLNDTFTLDFRNLCLMWAQLHRESEPMIKMCLKVDFVNGHKKMRARVFWYIFHHFSCRAYVLSSCFFSPGQTELRLVICRHLN